MCASLTRPCVDNVKFTVYEQDKPSKIVFLQGGDSTTDEWWFKDLEQFADYPDTLFVGVGQSLYLKDDLGIIIEYVQENYDVPYRNDWSFVGFSLGAYNVFSTALTYHYETFGNYAAIGGGTVTDLEENPNINLLYVCYGDKDYDKCSADVAVKDLQDKGYINEHNYVNYIMSNTPHNLEEAKNGLKSFLIYMKGETTMGKCGCGKKKK